MAQTLAPAAFIGHGTPMNALERNRWTEAWASFGGALEGARALLVVSAHWYINATAVTSMARPRTIHDFFGFPQQLFDMRYPAPGDPELASHIAEALQPHWVGLDADSWGLDHGTWSVLCHMVPDADIPVIQLSIDGSKPLPYHFELGRALHGLRSEGIAVIGSGNIVHHLGMLDMRRPDAGYDWAQSFDAHVVELLTGGDPSAILETPSRPEFANAVPTFDHYAPAVYFAGLVAEDPEPAKVLVGGCALGSLSMTSLTLGA
ncbi:MAG: 4,5-DOPA dioxygenase extradiol [Actinomycetota bacterium]|nr:4,5-DOPA dioxygenase extradiol [Actinomycetota bacterium]